ncbi:helix-turn-helix domain-containing protein [Streptomyces sp. NPDC015125]|uniref:helix-turn-helix domain-containing protein n=1 Tax=Streptomyces sp. NPDC015125 TaxID=3364938 RepID=UPI0036FC9782
MRIAGTGSGVDAQGVDGCSGRRTRRPGGRWRPPRRWADRSRQRTVAALNVHEQTVMYRTQRVDQLTGCTLATTGDLAELWIARRPGSSAPARTRGGDVAPTRVSRPLTTGARQRIRRAGQPAATWAELTRPQGSARERSLPVAVGHEVLFRRRQLGAFQGSRSPASARVPEGVRVRDQLRRPVPRGRYPATRPTSWECRQAPRSASESAAIWAR